MLVQELKLFFQINRWCDYATQENWTNYAVFLKFLISNNLLLLSNLLLDSGIPSAFVLLHQTISYLASVKVAIRRRPAPNFGG